MLVLVKIWQYQVNTIVFFELSDNFKIIWLVHWETFYPKKNIHFNRFRSNKCVEL